MIDIHAHLLPGVDDGAGTLSESLAMIRRAKEQGFQGIVLTPHFYPDNDMTSSIANNKILLEKLKQAIRDEGIEIFLFLGNEVFYSQDTLEQLEKGCYTTLNNSRYLLVETMRHSLDCYSFTVFLNQLRINGYIPIIAHPERYEFIQTDPNILVRLIQDGNLAQLNLLSLIGHYGSDAKAAAEILLTHNMVHFLASDAHAPKAYERFGLALDEAKKLVGEKRVAQLLEENPKRVLIDEKIETMEPCYYEGARKQKKSLLGFWKKRVQVG
jgi:protein-tyrosine phosphatase